MANATWHHQRTTGNCKPISQPEPAWSFEKGVRKKKMIHTLFKTFFDICKIQTLYIQVCRISKICIYSTHKPLNTIMNVLSAMKEKINLFNIHADNIIHVNIYCNGICIFINFI